MDFAEFKQNHATYAGCITIKAALNRACKLNDLSTLKYITTTWRHHLTEITISRNAIRKICRDNCTDIINYLIGENIVKYYHYFIKYGNMSIFMQVEQYCCNNDELFAVACTNPDPSIIKYMIANWTTPNIMIAAKFVRLIFRYDDLQLIQTVYNMWPTLFDKRFIATCFNRAIAYGHLDICQWLRELCPDYDYVRQLLSISSSNTDTNINFLFRNSYFRTIEWLSDNTQTKYTGFILHGAYVNNCPQIIDYIIASHDIKSTEEVEIHKISHHRLAEDIKRMWSTPTKSSRKI